MDAARSAELRYLQLAQFREHSMRSALRCVFVRPLPAVPASSALSDAHPSGNVPPPPGRPMHVWRMRPVVCARSHVCARTHSVQRVRHWSALAAELGPLGVVHVHTRHRVQLRRPPSLRTSAAARRCADALRSLARAALPSGPRTAPVASPSFAPLRAGLLAADPHAERPETSGNFRKLPRTAQSLRRLRRVRIAADLVHALALAAAERPFRR